VPAPPELMLERHLPPRRGPPKRSVTAVEPAYTKLKAKGPILAGVRPRVLSALYQIKSKLMVGKLGTERKGN
jgi:hypothetical protein